MVTRDENRMRTSFEGKTWLLLRLLRVTRLIGNEAAEMTVSCNDG